MAFSGALCVSFLHVIPGFLINFYSRSLYVNLIADYCELDIQRCNVCLRFSYWSDWCTVRHRSLSTRMLKQSKHSIQHFIGAYVVHRRQKLFQQLACNTDNCLHYLLPCMRDPTIINSLRHANKYPAIFAKTTKFKNSFICYGLSHYQ